MSRWFRLYEEMLDDHKVQSLSPELFKAWVNLLAVACRNEGVLPSVETLAFALRVSAHEMQTRIDDLVLAGLLDVLPDKRLEPHNWQKRQWKSDDSKERVRKHREAKRACNASVTVTVTPPEPDTEAETDTEKPKSSLKSASLGKARRGVSPRLQGYAQGLGLPVDELMRRATAPDVEEPNALFRHLALKTLQAMVPKANPKILSTALTKDGDSARAALYGLMLAGAP